MVRRMFFSMGVGSIFLSPFAHAQFATDAPSVPPQPAAPIGQYIKPILPAVPPAATNAFRPSATPSSMPVDLTALGTNHPLAIAPQHGNYMICLKSYSRPSRPKADDPGWTSLQLAEGLAQEIRQRYGNTVNVYLFEHISEEKRTEMAAKARAIAQANEFRSRLDAERQSSLLKGMEFIDSDRTIRYQTFNARDEIAVLIGGFATEEDARKALTHVRTWPSPSQAILMDGGAIARPAGNGATGGESVMEQSRINPFPLALVVPNPTKVKPVQAASASVDAFVVKLNEGRPYSLLNTKHASSPTQPGTKGWTLSVKSFLAPCQVRSTNETSAMTRKSDSTKGSDVLNACALQAETLAKMLRSMRSPAGQPLGLDAYVLHTRSGSLVTVGEFEGPNDPALVETRRTLQRLKFNTSKDDRGSALTGVNENFFGDNILPVPIPKR